MEGSKREGLRWRWSKEAAGLFAEKKEHLCAAIRIETVRYSVYLAKYGGILSKMEVFTKFLYPLTSSW
jgi:hypothetical protein